jgi:hypothetical protein
MRIFDYPIVGFFFGVGFLACASGASALPNSHGIITPPVGPSSSATVQELKRIRAAEADAQGSTDVLLIHTTEPRVWLVKDKQNNVWCYVTDQGISCVKP